MDGVSFPDPLTVEMKDGHPVDLGPLVDAGLVVRRHMDASPLGVTALLLGMRIAVGKLCGREAAERFDARVLGGD